MSLLLEFGRPTGCLPKRGSARPGARRKQQVNFLEVQKAFLRALFQRTVRVRVKQAWKLMQQSFRNRLHPDALVPLALKQKQIKGYFSRLAKAVKQAGRATLQQADQSGAEGGAAAGAASSSADSDGGDDSDCDQDDGDDGQEEADTNHYDLADSSDDSSSDRGSNLGAEESKEGKADDSRIDWMAYKVAALKGMCRTQGLRVGGKKAALIARLKAHQRG